MDKQQAVLDMFKALSAYSSHHDLYAARGMTEDPKEQARLGPLEHRAFAREYAQDEPIKAAVGLPFMIPAYTIGKAQAKEPLIKPMSLWQLPMHMATRGLARDMGLHNSRSPASLEEMKQGYIGLGEGLLSKLQSFGR